MEKKSENKGLGGSALSLACQHHWVRVDTGRGGVGRAAQPLPQAREPHFLTQCQEKSQQVVLKATDLEKMEVT